LLKQRKTPFIVALNKIDRIYDWKAIANNAVLESLAEQPDSVIREFEERVESTKVALAEQGDSFRSNRDLTRQV
jgi:translation initiation factor 5B